MSDIINFLVGINRNPTSTDLMMTIGIYIVIFFISCITGFIYEEIFYFITEKKKEKRGFLYGPYLPVYGFGSIFMLLVINPFKDNPLAIFFLSILVTGVLEYVTGAIMLKVWHKRWWDYRGLFLNIGGFVCLRSVLSFALMAFGLFYLIEPLTRTVFTTINPMVLLLVSGTIVVVMVIDLLFSIKYRDPIN